MGILVEDIGQLLETSITRRDSSYVSERFEALANKCVPLMIENGESLELSDGGVYSIHVDKGEREIMGIFLRDDGTQFIYKADVILFEEDLQRLVAKERIHSALILQTYIADRSMIEDLIPRTAFRGEPDSFEVLIDFRNPCDTSIIYG
ncbi:hypothetical protein HYV12_03530 [Candidatus Dojkabacteria bacterium]|nr:hypothetical protein [Candidatus Dojkabacteria bacterium]